jgi:hypothetical protein
MFYRIFSRTYLCKPVSLNSQNNLDYEWLRIRYSKSGRHRWRGFYNNPFFTVFGKHYLKIIRWTVAFY